MPEVAFVDIRPLAWRDDPVVLASAVLTYVESFVGGETHSCPGNVDFPHHHDSCQISVPERIEREPSPGVGKYRCVASWTSYDT